MGKAMLFPMRFSRLSRFFPLPPGGWGQMCGSQPYVLANQFCRAGEAQYARKANPPFKLASEFVAHALDLSPKVIMLLRLAFLKSVHHAI